MDKFEKNTILFYEELNNNCNPEILLNIAKKGIFLIEPLFNLSNYEKIKNHEHVVEISILADQFFTVNNEKQYKKYVELSKNKSISDKLYPYEHDSEIFYKLIIPNVFFFQQLMKETDEDFINEYIEYNKNYFLLYYLYKYKYIDSEILNLFILDYDCLDIRFEIFEYFYFENKEFLEDLYKVNNEYPPIIIRFIIEKNARDIKILEYCDKKFNNYKKCYGLLRVNELFRIPPCFPMNIMAKYTHNFFVRNNLTFHSEDKTTELIVNTIFSDEMIKNFKYLDKYKSALRYEINYECKYSLTKETIFDEEYLLMMDYIDSLTQENNFIDDVSLNHENEIIDDFLNHENEFIDDSLNHENKFIDDSLNHENEFIDIDGNFNVCSKKLINSNTKNNLIKKYDVHNFNNKQKYIIDNYYFFNCNNLYELPFVKKYLNSEDEINKILNKPNYMNTLNLDTTINEEYIIIKFTYLISLIHNGCSDFIIKSLISEYIKFYGIKYIHKKLWFYTGMEDYDNKNEIYIAKIFGVLSNTPNKLFNSYLW